MVLGPDLLGWRLTEARVWAMLRDEEALQARHTHKEEGEDLLVHRYVPRLARVSSPKCCASRCASSSVCLSRPRFPILHFCGTESDKAILVRM